MNLKKTSTTMKRWVARLLMPAAALKPRWDKLTAKSSVKEALEALAEHFGVSAPAVGWRVVALGWLKKGELPKLSARIATGKPKAEVHPLFSHRFVARSAWGIDQGELSVQRLLGLLDLKLDEFRECCKAYGVKAEIGL